MSYVPPPPGSTTLGQPTPSNVPKQDAHIADLPPEVRRSFLLSMVFFPSIVGAMVCLILFLGYWAVSKPKTPVQFSAELTSNDPRKRWMAARELAENIGNERIYDSKTLTALIDIVNNKDLDKEVEAWSPTQMIKGEDEKGSRLRWWATTMVGHFGGVLKDQAEKDRALETLTKALDDKELTVFAVRGLGLMKDPRALDALLKQLEKDDIGIRAAVANACGAIGSALISARAPAAEIEKYRLPLLQIYKTSQDDMVLDNAAIALARLGDAAGKSRLEKLEKSDDAVARDHARRALEALANAGSDHRAS